MKRIYLITITLVIAGFSSCKKYVDEKFYLALTDQTAITNEASAKEAILGMYNALQLNGNYGIYQISTPGLYSDELKSRSAIPDINQIAAKSVLPVNAYIVDLWSGPYRAVYVANQIMQKVPTITSIPEATRKAMVAEAKFVRGLSIFNILKFFGGAPLVTSTSLPEIEATRRSSVEETYNFIIADLLAAETDIPATHPGNGTQTSDQVSRVRATKAAVKALLARVYLYRAKDNNDFQSAIVKCDEVIGSTTPTYSLETAFADAFNLYSREAVFQIFFASNDQSRLNLEIFPGPQWNFAASDQLIGAFEPGDNRRAFTIIASGADFHSRKYQTQSSPANVIRLADVFLIRAEAKGRLTTPDLTGARNDLNAVRTRAGLGNNTATTAAQLLLDIEKERFVELAWEGHRFFDLVRTGRADAVLGPLFSGWQSTDKLLPIPFIEVSKGITQNPGY